MLPGAALYNAAIFRQRGEEVDTTAELILAALDWLQTQRVDVINISLSGEPNALLEQAVRQLLKQKQTLVAAAGNGGPSAAPAYPAAWPGVIAVTAVDSKLQIYRRANHGDYIDFAAPGVDVWAARAGGTGAAYHSGTSFAVPYVTAALAVTHRRKIKTPGVAGQPQHQLRVRDLGKPGKDRIFGHGLLQAQGGC